MATVISSIGTRATASVTANTVTGSGPWTVILAVAPTTTDVGDVFEDFSGDLYLITAVVGTDLTVTDLLGATTPPPDTGAGSTYRSYSTITLAEADLDDTVLYDAGDVAELRVMNDSAFDEIFTIDGGGTVGLGSVVLTAPTGERHDGTAGTGSRIVRTVSSAGSNVINVNRSDLTVEWLEINANGFSFAGGIRSSGGANNNTIYRKCIVHDIVSTFAATVAGIQGNITGVANGTAEVSRNIVYDFLLTIADASGLIGCLINVDTSGDTAYCYNNTCDRFVRNTGTGNCRGCGVSTDQSGSKMRNNMAFATSGTTTGTIEDFLTPHTTMTATHNMSEDTSAGGTGSLNSKNAVDQFISTTNGSENYHLKAGAAAIDAGVDLVTTPAGINFDIDNRDLDAQGDVWDMGADERVATTALTAGEYMFMDLDNAMPSGYYEEFTPVGYR